MSQDPKTDPLRFEIDEWRQATHKKEAITLYPDGTFLAKVTEELYPTDHSEQSDNIFEIRGTWKEHNKTLTLISDSVTRIEGDVDPKNLGDRITNPYDGSKITGFVDWGSMILRVP